MAQHELDIIRSLEEELLTAHVRRCPEAVRRLLAEDFVEFGRSGGVHDKEDAVLSLAAEGADVGESLGTRDFKLRSLADDVVLLTYRSFRFSSGKEERHTLRSSIWKHIDGRWQMTFHQGTPAQS